MATWVGALVVAGMLVGVSLALLRLPWPAWFVIPAWVLAIGLALVLLGWHATAGGVATAAVVLPFVADLADSSPQSPDGSVDDR